MSDRSRHSRAKYDQPQPSQCGPDPHVSRRNHLRHNQRDHALIPRLGSEFSFSKRLYKLRWRIERAINGL
jgi:hypothetical protein